ncbi:DUF6266 family protein [Chryseobacterium sp. Mn2064]|uniref:DUF6266 family protein n=1 Tax=Chryseobacterium sp. Mn2064 TaxID=3395263 RepID=UPI003BEE0BFD
MARITKGILGGFSGKVGTIVGANWRGKDIIRSIPTPSNRPPSEKQMVQQMKFKLVISFLRPLGSIQKKYFGLNSGSKSRINLAVSYTINEAVQMVADVPELIYNKILITKGDLTGFQNVNATPQAGNTISLTWEDNTTQGNAAGTDQVTVICYNKELDSFAVFEAMAERSALTKEVALPAYYAGKEMQVWAYLNRAEEDIACNSSYLGALTMI